MHTTNKFNPAEIGDGLLAILADATCRNVLSELRTRPEASTSLDALVADNQRGYPDGTTSTATYLHHVTLPKLAQANCIHYDPVAKTVQYTPTEKLETWFGATEMGESVAE